jgi:hypothetical protein
MLFRQIIMDGTPLCVVVNTVKDIHFQKVSSIIKTVQNSVPSSVGRALNLFGFGQFSHLESTRKTRACATLSQPYRSSSAPTMNMQEHLASKLIYEHQRYC